MLKKHMKKVMKKKAMKKEHMKKYMLQLFMIIQEKMKMIYHLIQVIVFKFLIKVIQVDGGKDILMDVKDSFHQILLKYNKNYNKN